MVWLRATWALQAIACQPGRGVDDRRTGSLRIGLGGGPGHYRYMCPPGLLRGRIPLYLQGNISNEKGRAGPESKGVRRRRVGGTGKADGG